MGEREGNFLLLYKLLKRYEKGDYGAKAGRSLGLSKQLTLYYTKQLKAKNLIQETKIPRGERVFSRGKFYQVTQAGLDYLKKSKIVTKNSLCMTGFLPKTRLHNLAIKFPILEDNPAADFPEETKLNGWIAKYEKKAFPVPLTLAKTTKNVILHFHQFETRRGAFDPTYQATIQKATIWAYQYLLKEKGIQIDILNGQTIRQHIANETPELNEAVPKSVTTSINLGRPAKAAFPADFTAKAWIDRSKGNVEIETNDKSYEEKFLQMPEAIDHLAQNLTPAIDNLTINLKTHLEVLQEIREAIRELKTTIQSHKN